MMDGLVLNDLSLLLLVSAMKPAILESVLDTTRLSGRLFYLTNNSFKRKECNYFNFMISMIFDWSNLQHAGCYKVSRVWFSYVRQSADWRNPWRSNSLPKDSVKHLIKLNWRIFNGLIECSLWGSVYIHLLRFHIFFPRLRPHHVEKTSVVVRSPKLSSIESAVGCERITWSRLRDPDYGVQITGSRLRKDRKLIMIWSCLVNFKLNQIHILITYHSDLQFRGLLCWR